MRNLSFAWAIAAVLFLGVTSFARAATITDNAGTLDAAHPFASYGYNPVTNPDFHLDNAGQGDFRVNFTLGDASSHTATSFTATAVIGKAIKDFTFGLYDSANHLLGQVDQTTAVSPDGHTTFSSLDFANLLKAGNYYLRLLVSAGNAGQIINGNIAIAAVPLPAALPMFGSVLAGLLLVTRRRRQMLRS